MSRLREPSPDIIEYVKSLEQRVRNLETTAQAGNTSVDSGALVVNTDDDTKFQVYINNIKQFEMGSTGGNADVRFWRPDGLTAFFITRFGDRYIMGFQDDNLHTVLGDDFVSGWGLGRPWVPVPFYEDNSLLPTRTTTSATYVNLQYARYNIQSPRFTARSFVHCSDGSTGGNIIMSIDGEEVVTTAVTIPVGSSTTFDQTLNFNTFGIDFGNYCDIHIKARRTAGAGTIGVRTIAAYGTEIPV